MVGVAGSGSAADADEFIAATGATTPTMVLDASFGVWNHYGVLSQPTTVLVDAGGNIIHEFPGQFDAADVLARL